MATEPFNPLDKRNLGISIANAIFSQNVYPLSNISSFDGAGIYAIYYKGKFPLYRKIAETNNNTYKQPIYAGKAVPEGARRGGMGFDVPLGSYLFRRLNEHKKSIESAVNLDINDFFYRFLLVDDIWIPLGESLVIEITRPLWNVVIDGFGNHDPGSGRYNQQISSWDTLHPGRSWAKNLHEGKAKNEIENNVKDFFSK
jgi:hypothetical protein